MKNLVAFSKFYFSDSICINDSSKKRIPISNISSSQLIAFAEKRLKETSFRKVKEILLRRLIEEEKDRREDINWLLRNVHFEVSREGGIS